MAFRRAPRSSNVGRHAARELKHLAGRHPRFVSPGRRRPSAARCCRRSLLHFAARRSSCFQPVARGRRRVRAHRTVSGSASAWRCHRAAATITPALCGLVFLAARSRSILSACATLVSTLPASMLSVPNPALGRTRGAAFPLRVAFRRAPLSSNVGRPDVKHRANLISWAAFCVAPSVAFAEVMDKEPSLIFLWSTAAASTLVALVGCRASPWFTLLSAPLPLIYGTALLF